MLLTPAAANYCCTLANMAGASTTAMKYGGAFADSESDDDRLEAVQQRLFSTGLRVCHAQPSLSLQLLLPVLSAQTNCLQPRPSVAPVRIHATHCSDQLVRSWPWLKKLADLLMPACYRSCTKLPLMRPCLGPEPLCYIYFNRLLKLYIAALA